MFSFCTDPSILPQWQWFACYLTTNTHFALYRSVLVVMLLLALVAPLALGLGMLGALAIRSGNMILRGIGKTYVSMVRGVPDIIFFLFVPIAIDQLVEFVLHRIRCPDWEGSVWRGNDFVVCAAAKMPLNNSPQWVHDTYSFLVATLTFAIVFGAFAANVLFGAMRAVPRGQLETAEAYGMSQRQTFWRVLVPQMWVFALPGLSNLWMVLIKATPLLFLLGIQDIVYWARELGGAAQPRFTAYPHPDWRMWYFLALLVFYLCFTKVSEVVLDRIMARLTYGQATAAGEAQRKAAT